MKPGLIDGKDSFLQRMQKNTEMREYRLIEKAVQILQRNTICDENAPWGEKRCIVPDKQYFKGIWNWDTAFHCVGISRIDPELAKEHMEAFCRYQLDDGMFPDVIFEDGKIVDSFGKPPVMAWACEIVYRKSQDREFLKRMYERLKKNVEFWEEKRKHGMLFHYDAAMTDGRKDPVGIRYESGWDNSVRWDSDEPENFWAVDLNCFMVMTYRSMDFMAEELGITDAKWYEKECSLAACIEQELWNEKTGCYTDKNYRTNCLSEVLTPASFMPLYAGTASKAHAEKCAVIAEEKFGYGMPTVSYDDPEYGTDYWRGPTWLNTAYFAAKGLKNYGYSEIADQIKETILGWVEKDGDCIHENYNSTTGEGLCAEYFSWSAVFVMEFILNF